MIMNISVGKIYNNLFQNNNANNTSSKSLFGILLLLNGKFRIKWNKLIRMIYII